MRPHGPVSSFGWKFPTTNRPRSERRRGVLAVAVAREQLKQVTLENSHAEQTVCSIVSGPEAIPVCLLRARGGVFHLANGGVTLVQPFLPRFGLFPLLFYHLPRAPDKVAGCTTGHMSNPKMGEGRGGGVPMLNARRI